jgi:hypothetical protein
MSDAIFDKIPNPKSAIPKSQMTSLLPCLKSSAAWLIGGWGGAGMFSADHLNHGFPSLQDSTVAISGLPDEDTPFEE